MRPIRRQPEVHGHYGGLADAKNIERQKQSERRAAELAVQNAARHEIQRPGNDAGPDDRRKQQPHRCSKQHEQIDPAAGDGLGIGLVGDQRIGR